MATSSLALWALGETETQYSQIEKEVLALTWSLSNNRVLGKHVVIDT